jgi:putative intracellular protease/amidase
MKKKVLMVITSHDKLGNTEEKTGYWLSELSHPWHNFLNAGFEIDFVSPKGGEVPMDPRSLDKKDSINQIFLSNKYFQNKIKNTKSTSEINSLEYDAILFVGGHGVMWDFPENKTIIKIATDIYESKGIIGAVCHGPAGIVNIILSSGKYLVDGKNISAFTNEEEKALKLDSIVPFSLEDKLIERGAKIIKAKMWNEKVSVDERLVTGQNPQSADLLSKKIVELLKNK